MPRVTERAKRAYDSSKRKQQAESSLRHIIQLTVEALKESPEVTLRSVARASGVSERHLYRLFGDFHGLARAVNEEINALLGTEELLAGVTRDSLSEDAVRLFQQFSAYSELIVNYLDSPLGRACRQDWLQRKRLLLVQRFGPEAGPVAFLLSASLWRQLREECQMSDQELSSFVQRLSAFLTQPN